MNDHEAERIADAMNRLRPDWPVKSLRTLLARPELASRARRDIAVALAWVACEPDTHTPARVLENGPWWKAAGVTGELTRRHPTPQTACRDCGQDVDRHPHPSCDTASTRPTPRDPAAHTAHAAAARQLLATERTTP